MLETYVIHVTHRCNMKCLYCYESDKESTFTWEETKERIDKIIENSSSNKFHLEFLGGEPMLAWDLIKKIYEYIEIEYYEKVFVNYYGLTNNGTILTEEQLDYLSKNKRITYAISLDGTKAANQFRIMKKDNSNSYDIVVNNIKRLIEKDVSINVHLVVHPYNVSYLEESIFHLYNDLGVKSIGVGTIESTMYIDEDFMNEFIRQMDNVSKRMIDENLLDILHIDILNYVKPKEDVRTYIYDKETGRIIAESYGRIENKYENDDSVIIRKCGFQEGTDGELIYKMRLTSYKNHRRNIALKSKRPEGELWD